MDRTPSVPSVASALPFCAPRGRRVGPSRGLPARAPGSYKITEAGDFLRSEQTCWPCPPGSKRRKDRCAAARARKQALGPVGGPPGGARKAPPLENPPARQRDRTRVASETPRDCREGAPANGSRVHNLNVLSVVSTLRRTGAGPGRGRGGIPAARKAPAVDRWPGSEGRRDRGGPGLSGWRRRTG